MAMRYYAPFPGSGGYGRPRGPHALRIGDAERDAAAADLGEHYVVGRLTLDEMNERLEAVFAAKTYGQLARIMADLPGRGRLPWLTAPPATWRAAGWAAGGIASLAGNPRAAPTASPPGFPPGSRERGTADTDRTARYAALSLLLLAMLIWLFTALLFARYGLYHQVRPPAPGQPFSPFGHR